MWFTGTKCRNLYSSWMQMLLRCFYVMFFVVLCEINLQEIRLNQEQLKLLLPHGAMIQIYQGIYSTRVSNKSVSYVSWWNKYRITLTWIYWVRGTGFPRCPGKLLHLTMEEVIMDTLELALIATLLGACWDEVFLNDGPPCGGRDGPPGGGGQGNPGHPGPPGDGHPLGSPRTPGPPGPPEPQGPDWILWNRRTLKTFWPI